MSAFLFTVTERASEKDRWFPSGSTANSFIHTMMQKGHEVGMKDGTGIIAATFKTGARLEQKNVETVTGLILDIDGKFRRTGESIPAGATLTEDGKHYIEVVPPDTLLAKLPYCGFAHSSHSHGPAHPKYRVIMPLKEAITPSEFMRLWFWIYEKVDRKADAACKNPERMFFFPRCTQEAKDAGWPWVRAMFGPPLSYDMIPADYQIPDEFRRELDRPRRQQGAHFTAPQSHFRPTDANKLLEVLIDLPIYHWAVEHAEEVGRETWRGLATNIAAAVLEDETAHEAGAKAFHEISECDDARYNVNITEKTFRDALKSAQSPGPMTYKTMKLNGAPEEIDEGNAKSPVAHARYTLSSQERNQRPKHLAPVSSLTVTGAVIDLVPNGTVTHLPLPEEPVAAATDAAPDYSTDPTDPAQATTAFQAPEESSEPDEPDEPDNGPTIQNYSQTDILLDVQRNGWIFRETNLYTGEVKWALEKVIKDEAFNKRLISQGLPRKGLDTWKQWIAYFDFRKCVYTSDQLLIDIGPSIVFNTYKPPRLVPVAGNWDNIRALFLHLVGNDPDALEYFLDWCAWPLQKIRNKEPPNEGHYKNGTSVVLRGDPGAGKGTAMTILKLCYGLSNCVELGQEDLDGKFHSNLIDKLFVVGNEVMSSSNRSLQTANKLKSWITDPVIPCEGKYSDAGETENNFNIIFTSNDDRPMLVEKGDRRYTIFQSTVIAKSIINPIRDDLIQGQQEVAAFYDAMLARKVKMKYGDLYQTEARVQVQLASASTSERFAAEIQEDGFLSVSASWIEAGRNGEIRNPTVTFNNEQFVLADTLMTVYKHYCTTIGAHPQHVRALSQALQAVFPNVEPSYRITVGHIQRRAWRGIPIDSPNASVLPMPIPAVTPVPEIPKNEDDVSFEDGAAGA